LKLVKLSIFTCNARTSSVKRASRFQHSATYVTIK
jgi:hypothetical protein